MKQHPRLIQSSRKEACHFSWSKLRSIPPETEPIKRQTITNKHRLAIIFTNLQVWGGKESTIPLDWFRTPTTGYSDIPEMEEKNYISMMYKEQG